VIIHVENSSRVDEVVFAEPGDLSLLGARTLEGFNARVDPKRKKLVVRGPLTAAGGKSQTVDMMMPQELKSCYNWTPDVSDG